MRYWLSYHTVTFFLFPILFSREFWMTCESEQEITKWEPDYHLSINNNFFSITSLFFPYRFRLPTLSLLPLFLWNMSDFFDLFYPIFLLFISSFSLTILKTYSIFFLQAYSQHRQTISFHCSSRIYCSNIDFVDRMR